MASAMPGFVAVPVTMFRFPQAENSTSVRTAPLPVRQAALRGPLYCRWRTICTATLRRAAFGGCVPHSAAALDLQPDRYFRRRTESVGKSDGGSAAQKSGRFQKPAGFLWIFVKTARPVPSAYSAAEKATACQRCPRTGCTALRRFRRPVPSGHRPG